jgi:two-component system sensor histidine kinase BaeS
VKSLLSEVYGLSQLVGDLHDFALADAGSLSYRMECTDLGAVLRESVEVFHTRMRERGLKLELNVPEQPLCVDADPARLRQVFHNLLENATRYTSAGGRVQLHAVRERDVVLVEMQDSAPGVLEHELPLLFDRFYRCGRPGARPAGSGLGLAICRAVAEAHRGSIQAAASPLGGLCIALRLPALD